MDYKKELKAKQKEIDGVVNEIDSIEDDFYAQMRDATSDLFDKKSKLKNEHEEIVAAFLKENRKSQYSASTEWECKKSPIGWCVFHPDDECWDECIYCGNPDERK